MNKSALRLIALAILIGSPAFAQEAPPPQKMPRLPVHRLNLGARKDNIPQSRLVEGTANILDAERLKIGDVELRLFGIVPPQLSASFGPQARSTLDALVRDKNVSCSIRDRDHEGRYLATCQTVDNNDLALELIKRGLAVAARGSLAETDLANTYLAAEQNASAARAGLWSVVVPISTNSPNNFKPEIAGPDSSTNTFDNKEIKTNIATEKSSIRTQKEISLTHRDYTQPLLPDSEETFNSSTLSTSRFFVVLFKYQSIFASLLTLVTALILYLTLVRHRTNDKRDELKAIAAALRGELMAARAVCHARIKTKGNDDEDRSAAWPRIRSTLFQAYVGRIGWLGAELARQVASIYGQANDYTSYFKTLDDSQPNTTSKRQALEILVRYIESVLPRLAAIEESGLIQYKPNLVPAAQVQVTDPVLTQDEVIQNDEDSELEDEIEIANDDNPKEETFESESTKNYTPSPIPLWKAMSNFTRQRITNNLQNVMVDPVDDYSTLLEEEAANYFVETQTEDPAETAIIRIAKLGSGRG